MQLIKKSKKKNISTSLQPYLDTQTACTIISCLRNQMDLNAYYLLNSALRLTTNIANIVMVIILSA